MLTFYGGAVIGLVGLLFQVFRSIWVDKRVNSAHAMSSALLRRMEYMEAENARLSEELAEMCRLAGKLGAENERLIQLMGDTRDA